MKLTAQEAFERKQAHDKKAELEAKDGIKRKVVRSSVVYTAPFKGICVSYTFRVIHA